MPKGNKELTIIFIVYDLFIQQKWIKLHVYNAVVKCHFYMILLSSIAS